MARLLLTLLAGLVLSVGIAACGGTQISADEVSAAPPDLTIPTQDAKSADALADPAETSNADSSGSGSTGTDKTDTTDSPSQPGDEPATGGTSAPTGTATPQPQPQATATPSNPGGSQAPAQPGSAPSGTSGTEKFEEFCQQNAGAC